MGLKTVMLDNDPQASLTAGTWGPEVLRTLHRDETIAALYNPTLEPIAESLIRPTGFENLSIVPGSPALARYNTTPEEAWPQSERGITDFVDEIRPAM
jgi:cellulose biosynthesis protein BcsQ